jgi:hypothetical protein
MWWLVLLYKHTYTLNIDLWYSTSILTSSSHEESSLPHGTREDEHSEDYSLGSCSVSGSYGHVFNLPNLPSYSTLIDFIPDCSSLHKLLKHVS